MSTTVVQDLASIRQGIDETHRRFEDAFNHGDAAGAARQLYTRDARILPPGRTRSDAPRSPSRVVSGRRRSTS